MITAFCLGFATGFFAFKFFGPVANDDWERRP